MQVRPHVSSDDFYQTGGNDLYANLPNAFDFWPGQDSKHEPLSGRLAMGPLCTLMKAGGQKLGDLGVA